MATALTDTSNRFYDGWVFAGRSRHYKAFDMKLFSDEHDYENLETTEFLR